MPVQATQLDVEQSNAVIIEPTEQNHWQNLYSRHLEHLLFLKQGMLSMSINTSVWMGSC